MPENSTKNQNTASSASSNPLSDLIAKFSFDDTEDILSLERQFRAALAKLTRGMSPLEILLAYIDWLAHLAISPGKLLLLATSLHQELARLGKFIDPKLIDPKFADPGNSAAHAAESTAQANPAFKDELWRSWPFNLFSEAYTSLQLLLNEAREDVAGVSHSHTELVEFINLQIIAALSPANFPFSNPEVIQATRAEQGENLKRGLKALTEDIGNHLRDVGTPSAETGDDTHGDDAVDARKRPFIVGKDVAVTPGKVIFENRLIELIQYSPTTDKVHKNPVLIVPPWIMKFYILDLTPNKSLINYLVNEGHSVFVISWKNPTVEDRDLSMDDYLELGLYQALTAVAAVCPKSKVNAVGYCIGGTLLAIGAAALAADMNDDKPAAQSICSITLLAAQTDFSEAGEIKRLLGESQISFIESLMDKQGYLDAANMSDAFKALRPAELIWAPRIERYLLGREPKVNELMAWSDDATRMPYRMHSDYLRQLYLNNLLAQGKYRVQGKVIDLRDIKQPLFVVSTRTDHIAPWPSVYKILRLITTEATFLLTNGGHNAGIACGAKHPRRCYQVSSHPSQTKILDCDQWLETTPVIDGSWWPEWNNWLSSYAGTQVTPPRMGAARKGYKVLRAAPGKYVSQD